MNTRYVTETVENHAAKDYRMAEIFQDIDIDFCYDLSKSLKGVGHKINTPEDQLKLILQQSNVVKTIELHEYHSWDIDSLIDYIINNHHQYAKDNTVIIYELAQKVANRHCESHPEFSKLITEIFLFFHDLLNQMTKEESILFPNIKKIIKNRGIPGKATKTTLGLIKDSIKLMQKEHEGAVRYLKTLRKITNNYKCPADACNSCYYLFGKMKEFETDLLLHLHLESNILFPKAIAMDDAL